MAKDLTQKTMDDGYVKSAVDALRKRLTPDRFDMVRPAIEHNARYCDGSGTPYIEDHKVLGMILGAKGIAALDYEAQTKPKAQSVAPASGTGSAAARAELNLPSLDDLPKMRFHPKEGWIPR